MMKRRILIFFVIILISVLFLISNATVSYAECSTLDLCFSDYDGSENVKTYLESKGLYYVSGNQEMINFIDYGYMMKLCSDSRWVMWMYPDKPGIKKIADENFVLEFDFMQQTKSAVSDIATTTSELWTEDRRACRLYSDGTDLLLYTLSGQFAVIENYKENTVYNIKLAFNFENKTIKVWVNNTALLTDVKLEFLNTINDISRIDFNNLSGDGDLCIGKVCLYTYNDTSEELGLLKMEIDKVEEICESLEGGEFLGQCDDVLLKNLENIILQEKKKYSLWKNRVDIDKETVICQTDVLKAAADNVVKSIKKVYLEIYDMDFDSETLEEDGWLLTGDVHPCTFVEDNGNKVY